ncbi:MAG: hypothetical protein COC08_05880 [Maribacter sp.]|nr:MAG: hypothetical protein COC08_05880 [Maribacter sp.]
MVCHNHPSGVAEPSLADRRITERLKSEYIGVESSGVQAYEEKVL